jgi:hypothetical protein
MIVLLLVLLVIVYTSFLIYQIIFEDRSLLDLKTWNPLAYEKGVGNEPPMSDNDPAAPTVTGLKCMFPGSDIMNNKIFNKEGDALDLNDKIACVDCNQYIHKSGGKCSLYNYDKELNERGSAKPTTGTCTSRKKTGACPF